MVFSSSNSSGLKPEEFDDQKLMMSHKMSMMASNDGPSPLSLMQ